MTPQQYVEQKAAASGSSFYYAFLFLPPERRAAITAFYAFCREVDDVVDERNDPMRSAEAAARLMQQNYSLLGEWPLTITAYNHGTTGVARAAREIGSRELADLIGKYDNKNFGFASQNFYACFLAALHVARNSDRYLGSIPRARKLEFDEFVMPDFMSSKDFIEKMQIDETVFRELNPALTEEVGSL